MEPKVSKQNTVLPEERCEPERDEDRRTRFGVAIKLVSLLILFGLMFVLAQNMVRHHFFTGGAQNYHNSPTGP